MFVSIAGSFASNVRSLFSSVITTANKSKYDETYDVEGETFNVKILSYATYKDFSEYGKKVYHRAFIVGDDLFVDVNRITIDKAAAILKSGVPSSSSANSVYNFNTYTFKPDNAYSVMAKAFPGARIFTDVNNGGKNGCPVFKHYHADYGGTGNSHSIKRHSFYGGPIY